MIQLAAVALGGATGSVLRYGIQKVFNTSFPSGTLLVNITGCFLIGVLLATVKPSDEQKRLLLMAGFCGGFTTFSTFTLEGIQMMMNSRWATAFLYTAASVAGGLLATFLGYKIFNS
ncbi:MAG TPA: fluoride efflux transporter CrcB [Flavisolibacter sp.]|jgi:CrcB protein|nr:fluoride efflux transporter CrcB [Flavisolibacter sp.]